MTKKHFLDLKCLTPKQQPPAYPLDLQGKTLALKLCHLNIFPRERLLLQSVEHTQFTNNRILSIFTAEKSNAIDIKGFIYACLL